jgi:8-oxo-dGTP pyrophosphatase MutT (NUDIX family)
MQRFSSVVLVDGRGWVLLQERDEHPAIDPEKWGFVGGHLDDGEDYVAGAYRELEEETGLRLEGGLALFGEFTVHHEHSGTLDDFQVFVMRTDLTDDDLECHEGRQIVFVEPSRARGLDLTAAAAIALPAFLDSPEYAAMVAPINRP